MFYLISLILDAAQGKLILDKRINLNDYKIIKTIGRGAFGKVQLVRFKENNQVWLQKSGLRSHSSPLTQKASF